MVFKKCIPMKFLPIIRTHVCMVMAVQMSTLPTILIYLPPKPVHIVASAHYADGFC